MALSNRDSFSARLAGLLMFLGAAQWFLVIQVTEGLHPGYNSGIHYVSSLGVGGTALLYNSSVILLGFATLVAAFLLRGSHSSRLFTVLLAVTGLATMGVGVFPENVRPHHGIVTPVALLAGGLAAVASYRVQSSRLRYVSVLLGVGSILAGLLFNSYLGLPRESGARFMGLAKGTMERLVIYPLLLWIMGYGSSLTTASGVSRSPRARRRIPIPFQKPAIDCHADQTSGLFSPPYFSQKSSKSFHSRYHTVVLCLRNSELL